MARKFPLHPAHPERTCWGCDRYCPAGDMICGNGSERTQHPIELSGDGWESEGLDPVRPAPVPLKVATADPAPPGEPGAPSAGRARGEPGTRDVP